VLHVVTRLGLGGAEQVAEALAVGFVARGSPVLLASIASPVDRELADRAAAAMAAGGVEVLAGSGSANVRVAAMVAASRLTAAVRDWRPDLVHLHTEIPEFAWAIATLRSARARRLPIVRTVHNSVLWGGWGIAGRVAERRLHGARVAAVSEAAARAFVDWRRRAVGRAAAGDTPPVVIRNGVECSTGNREPRAASQPPRLCFAGRFEPQKGIDVLVQAVDRLAADGRDLRVVAFGSGSLEASVREAAARSGGRLTVAPAAPDLRSRLGSFDAVVVPSRFEGMSLLAVEAICEGLPVLATDAPGLNEAIPPWYPGRCRPGDPDALAAMLGAFLDDSAPWLASIARARSWAADRYSPAGMLDGYERLYEASLSAG
jgi:glycosyltransferase involved in cell wall biosynthesis